MSNASANEEIFQEQLQNLKDEIQARDIIIDALHISERGALYYIWSNEHNAWWKPGHRGYTKNAHEAGVYDGPDSHKIVTGANICTKGGIPNEIRVPWVDTCYYKEDK